VEDAHDSTCESLGQSIGYQLAHNTSSRLPVLDLVTFRCLHLTLGRGQMGIPATRAIYDRIAVAPPRNIARYLQIAKGFAVASIAMSPLWLRILFFTSPDYSPTSSFIAVPLLAIVGVVMVLHFTQRDPYLRRLLMAGLIAHMVAASIFLWIGFYYYGGAVDALHYWTMGVWMSYEFQVVGWSVFQPPYWGSNLINNMCGLAAILVGDALPTLFIAFALVPLAGAYAFYRAFTTAFPDGDRWLFGLLAVLSPSLLFWSSFIGKDALIQYSIALACLGFAMLAQQRNLKGVVLCALGLAGTAMIRGHITALLAIAMTFPYIVSRSKAGFTVKAARIVLVPVLAVGTYFLVSRAISQTGNLLDLQPGASAGVVEDVNGEAKNSQLGGSVYNEGVSLPVRLAESPFLLFRPFPWEMHSVLSIASAIESIGWMVLCWVRRREIRSTLRRWRDPYVCFLLTYSAVFMLIFGAAISNFGILLRERIMFTPLVFMIICAQRKPLIQDAASRLKGNRWLAGPREISPSGRISTEA
jgi:hypothetical protein